MRRTTSIPSRSGKPQVEQDERPAAAPPTRASRPRRSPPRRSRSRGPAGCARPRRGCPRRPRRAGWSARSPAHRSCVRLRRGGAGATGSETSTASPPSSLGERATSAAHRLDQAADHREPGSGARARCPPRAARRGRTSRTGGGAPPRQRPGRCPRPGSRTMPSTTAAPIRIATTRRHEGRGIVEQVGQDLAQEHRVGDTPGQVIRPVVGQLGDRPVAADIGPPRRAPIPRPASASRSARSAPPSIRPMSRRLVTIRFRCSASRSIASALAHAVRLRHGLRAFEDGPGGGPDGGQRRPEIMRHRFEERRLQPRHCAARPRRCRASAASRSCSMA